MHITCMHACPAWCPSLHRSKRACLSLTIFSSILLSVSAILAQYKEANIFHSQPHFLRIIVIFSSSVTMDEVSNVNGNDNLISRALLGQTNHNTVITTEIPQN